MGVIRNLATFAIGIGIGGAAGWATARLLAPQSGPEMQQALRDKVETITSAGEAAKAERQAEMEREFQAKIRYGTP